MSTEKEILITNLSFELTRKCNRNCDFCFRGKAENKDISKEIIDKTFDEVKDYTLLTIELTGGEPFLNEDGLCYVVDKIIKNHIKLFNLTIFTNATIINPKIKESLEKLGQYIKSFLESEQGENLKKIHSEEVWTKKNYDFSEGEYINVIVSRYQHENEQCIDNFVDVYRSDFVGVVEQEEYTSNNTVLVDDETKFSDFHRDKPLSVIRAKHCIIDDGMARSILINEPISISVNGEVYLGKCIRYSKIKDNLLFNVFDLRGNFFDRIDSWCWSYYINRDIDNQISSIEGAKFKQLNGAELSETEKRLLLGEKFMYDLEDYLNEIGRRLHNRYSFLGHYEIFVLLSFYTYLDYMDENNIESTTWNDIELVKIMEPKSATDKRIDKEILNDSIVNLINENELRKQEHEQNEQFRLSILREEYQQAEHERKQRERLEKEETVVNEPSEFGLLKRFMKKKQ
ncbi:hypothetical protein P261_00431 [Lachnospiraceae bacterium TWA4]|nr:hypothetical protein P261_00431 [Lachnospiraceae bacterium TWA4]